MSLLKCFWGLVLICRGKSFDIWDKYLPLPCSETGEVSLREKLDMERMRQHLLIIVIKDVNNKDNFATLIVDVLDDNDHEPKFMADLIQTRLPDNADLGASVIQVQAYDSDHGINGELRYSILHGNKGSID